MGLILLLFALSANAEESKLYEHINKCWNYAKDDWWEYNVYVTYDKSWRIEGKFTYVQLAAEPKPAGKRRYFGCNILDKDEKPRLTKTQDEDTRY